MYARASGLKRPEEKSSRVAAGGNAEERHPGDSLVNRRLPHDKEPVDVGKDSTKHVHAQGQRAPEKARPMTRTGTDGRGTPLDSGIDLRGRPLWRRHFR